MPRSMRSVVPQSRLVNLAWDIGLNPYMAGIRNRTIWVVVKIMVPFWVLSIIRHLVFRDPKRGHNFDNHPYTRPAEGDQTKTTDEGQLFKKDEANKPVRYCLQRLECVCQAQPTSTLKMHDTQCDEPHARNPTRHNSSRHT